MNKREYRSILGQLPVKNPSAEDMARFCPHLTQEQAVSAFKEGSGYVAVPPLAVQDSFQIISYHPEWVEYIRDTKDGKRVVTGTKNHPSYLDYSYAGRISKFDSNDASTEYKYAREAIVFANKYWGDDLIVDNWKSSLSIYVQDPTDLVNDRYHTDYPRTKVCYILP